MKKRRYAEAYELTNKALQEEPSFAKLGDVIQRVQDLAEIFAGIDSEVIAT